MRRRIAGEVEELQQVRELAVDVPHEAQGRLQVQQDGLLRDDLLRAPGEARKLPTAGWSEQQCFGTAFIEIQYFFVVEACSETNSFQSETNPLYPVASSTHLPARLRIPPCSPHGLPDLLVEQNHGPALHGAAVEELLDHNVNAVPRLAVAQRTIWLVREWGVGNFSVKPHFYHADFRL